MASHEAKRVLWFPAELLEPPPGEDPDHHLKALRERARGISDPARVALALNLLTEEGLPHFHRLLAVYLGTDSIWAKWNNLWTAEEDRHGAILHDYTRDAGVFDPVVIEKMQFDYIKAGFEPEWDKDPYRVFVYTSLQERATQVSHANTGKFASQYEPTIGTVLANVAKEEARHYTFYRSVFKAVLERDPNQGLVAAAKIMPAIDMPGVNMPHFRELADVVRRAGIYGPRDYLKIVEELIKYWSIDTLERSERSRARGAGKDHGDSGASRAHRQGHGAEDQTQELRVRRDFQSRIRNGIALRAFGLLISARRSAGGGSSPAATLAWSEPLTTLPRSARSRVSSSRSFESRLRGPPPPSLTRIDLAPPLRVALIERVATRCKSRARCASHKRHHALEVGAMSVERAD